MHTPPPSPFLEDNIHRLPEGRALDLAAGSGRNAVFLARNGRETTAVDRDEQRLESAKALASAYRVPLEVVVADLEVYDPGTETYDLIIDFYFLQRDLAPKMIAALRPGGAIVFETFTTAQLRQPGNRIKTRDFLLEPGELKSMFSPLKIVHYGESIKSGCAVASMIASRQR